MMSLLAPALLLGLSALAIPVLIHLVQRERRQVIPFPSLMFLRRIPYQSVRRRRIRDWLLLALRAAALLLIVLAFTRPFFARGTLASVAAGGGRETVILLDRSASMAYGDHWRRAQDAARGVVARLDSADRATLVLFDATAEESVRATGNRARLDEAIAVARPGSGATRYGPALKLALSILAKSSLPRREAVLVSDFQKSGWRGGDDVRFAEGTALTAISVASNDTRNVSVPSVSLARAPFAGKERVTITAAIANRGNTATDVPVSLQVGNTVLETLTTKVPPNASTAASFAPFTLGTPGLAAIVRAGSDPMPDDNVFRLVLAPASTIAVLLVDADTAGPSSLYLRNALSIGTAPAYQVDVVPSSRVTAALLDHHGVVVLNGVAASRIGSSVLRQFVERGGGLFMLLGGDTLAADRRVEPTQDDPLPGAAAGDDAEAHVTTVGFVDYSHPVFELFQGAHGGDFSGARVYRYRTLSPRRDDRILARFSDGGVALLERRLGRGRAIAWSSTLDDSWNDLAVKPIFLPFVQQVIRYLAQYEDEPSSRTVGQAIDLARAVRTAAGGTVRTRPSGQNAIVLTPSGQRVEHGADGQPLRFVDLDEQGFYELRTPAAEPVRVAVNLDPAESDLTPMDPQELVGAVTGHARRINVTGAVTLTGEELERRQSLWWYLLLGALLLLALDTALSNRLSAAVIATAGGADSGGPRRSGSSAARYAASKTTSDLEGRADVAR